MIQSKSLRTEAIVLRRTNYGEADRILLLLTPEGKKSALAKSVRKEKSKLAGGIEMFCLSEVVLYQGKTELLTLTSAKMLKFYQQILADLDKIETASAILKMVAKDLDVTEAAEVFSITKQSLEAIDQGKNVALIQAWFYLNFAKASGEQINVFFDADGEKLNAKLKYTWDSMSGAFSKNPNGKYGVNEIKMLRLILSAKLDLILRVAEAEEMAEEILFIAKSISQV